MYLQSHPDAKQFHDGTKFINFIWFDELDSIFNGSTATGARVRSIGDAPRQTTAIEEVMENESDDEEFTEMTQNFWSPIAAPNRSLIRMPDSSGSESARVMNPKVTLPRPTLLDPPSSKKFKNGSFAIADSIAKYSEAISSTSRSSREVPEIQYFAIPIPSQQAILLFEYYSKESIYFSCLSSKEKVMFKQALMKPENAAFFLILPIEEAEEYAKLKLTE